MNYDTLYPLKCIGECFDNNVVSAIDIGVDEPAITSPEQPPLHPTASVLWPLLRKLIIQKATLAMESWLDGRKSQIHRYSSQGVK
jgi:hypothetical protein